MQPSELLNPTLWRTCRVLANLIRIEMLGLLFRRPDQTVSAVARTLRQPLALTSLYLRALEARGLLTVRRTGRWASYRPGSTARASAVAGLVRSLRTTFQREAKPVETIFRLATAFTHPRRIELFRLLQNGPRRVGQLCAEGHLSRWALLRHLDKLEARGFIRNQEGLYAVINRQTGLRGELARMAVL